MKLVPELVPMMFLPPRVFYRLFSINIFISPEKIVFKSAYSVRLGSREEFNRLEVDTIALYGQGVDRTYVVRIPCNNIH